MFTHPHSRTQRESVKVHFSSGCIHAGRLCVCHASNRVELNVFRCHGIHTYIPGRQWTSTFVRGVPTARTRCGGVLHAWRSPSRPRILTQKGLVFKKLDVETTSGVPLSLLFFNGRGWLDAGKMQEMQERLDMYRSQGQTGLFAFPPEGRYPVPQSMEHPSSGTPCCRYGFATGRTLAGSIT